MLAEQGFDARVRKNAALHSPPNMKLPLRRSPIACDPRPPRGDPLTRTAIGHQSFAIRQSIPLS